ncbi:hypothetical protein L4C54_19340 [Vibrio lamellibrachiae]|uniref:hypothetical protein n=1 Tax=Vibrio lamellibrachiae TaxID=2910253 RepID=UPI003D12A3C2
MRHHLVFIIIAAVLLISLPTKVKSQHCVEARWNQALKEQTEIEHWYNQRARRFNLLYEEYQQQILLNKEFSLNELVQFWRPDTTDFHQKMTQQIALSLRYATLVEYEREALNVGIPSVKTIQENWKNFINHCQDMDLNVNALSSYQYYVSNDELLREIELLSAKLSYMQKQYADEAQALSKARDVANEKYQPEEMN